MATITTEAGAAAVWREAIQLAQQVFRVAAQPGATVVEATVAGALAERVIALAQFEQDQREGAEEAESEGSPL